MLKENILFSLHAHLFLWFFLCAPAYYILMFILEIFFLRNYFRDFNIIKFGKLII